MDYKLSQRFLYVTSVAFLLCISTSSAQTAAIQMQSSVMASAERALLEAESDNAAILATEAYQQAQSAYAQAQVFLVKRKTKEVERWAMKSIRYSELAKSQVHYVQFKEAVDNKISENARLRRELLMGDSGHKP